MCEDVNLKDEKLTVSTYAFVQILEYNLEREVVAAPSTIHRYH